MRLASLLILMSVGPAMPLLAEVPPAPPATRPAAAGFLVTIIPVQVVGNGTPAWIGRSVQQSLQAEVSAAGYALYDKASPTQAAQRPQIDPGVMVDVICRGQGSDLSIQGSVIDLATQSPIRHLRIDGNSRDFLAMKDQARAQLRQILDQRRDAMQAATAPLSTQLPAPVPPPPQAQPPANPNPQPPGSTFEDSPLLWAVDNPAAFEQQYRGLYNQRTGRSGYGYTPGYMGYPGFYGYGFYGPSYILQRGCSQQIGLGFGFTYTNGNTQINVNGGFGQNSGGGSTTGGGR